MRKPVNITCIKIDDNLHWLRTVKCLLGFRHRVLQGVLQIHTNSRDLWCCIWSVDLDKICVKTPVGRQLSSEYTSAKAQEHKLFQHESGIHYTHFTNSRSAWSTQYQRKKCCVLELGNKSLFSHPVYVCVILHWIFF